MAYLVLNMYKYEPIIKSIRSTSMQILQKTKGKTEEDRMSKHINIYTFGGINETKKMFSSHKLEGFSLYYSQQHISSLDTHKLPSMQKSDNEV